MKHTVPILTACHMWLGMLCGIDVATRTMSPPAAVLFILCWCFATAALVTWVLRPVWEFPGYGET